MLNKFLQKDPPVAAELFAASWCNLDCKYCDIPKHNQKILDKHQEIIEEIKQVDPYINRLKELYGEELQILSHWGSEPSLTLEYFRDFYKRALQEFPKLNTISLSSNFLSEEKIKEMAQFIHDFPREREFSFDVQLSLDGPKWITDENRRGGATESIMANMVKFVEEVNKSDTPHKVKTHFKPTMSGDQFPKMLEGDTALEYFRFFDDVCGKLVEANSNNKVLIAFNADPTVVCPGGYTKQDGENFNALYELTQKIAAENCFRHVVPDSGYYHNFAKLPLLGNEFFTKQKMFTCSAGDSQFGVSEYLHPCHDTFYMPYPEVKEAAVQDKDREFGSDDAESIRSGRYDVATEELVKPIYDISEKEMLKYIYKLRGFHDFARERISYCVAVIKEMAYAGQVSACYKYDDMAYTLAAFSISRHSCPTGHEQYIGSMHLMHLEYFKLFGNGLVENFIKRYLKEEHKI